MTTLTSPKTAHEPRARPAKRPRDVAALTGGLFVLVVVGAFVVAGNTPDGNASAEAVIAHYTDNRTQGIIAPIVLALAAVPTLAFAARLRERGRLTLGADHTLSNLAFGAGIVTAAGFLGTAAIHLALSDYARDLDLSAAQALNALDADSFLVFSTGLAALVLATSLIALRGKLLPAWLGRTGIVIAIAMFTPVGFFAACVAGVWIIVISVLLYTSGEQATERGNQDPATADGSRGAAARGADLTPSLGA